MLAGLRLEVEGRRGKAVDFKVGDHLLFGPSSDADYFEVTRPMAGNIVRQKDLSPAGEKTVKAGHQLVVVNLGEKSPDYRLVYVAKAEPSSWFSAVSHFLPDGWAINNISNVIERIRQTIY